MSNETLPDTARDELMALYDEAQAELENSSDDNDFLHHVVKTLHQILFFRMNNLMDTADVWDDVDEDEPQGFEMYTDEGDAAVAEMLRRIQGDVTSRSVVAEALQNGIDSVGEKHPEVYDLEPQIAIESWVNEHVCLAHGWEPFLIEEL